ncbi:hypothetical protein EUX98_g4890 [Antrodiella citrinella]|uniref:OTU domain-containing protein n=1 Tax=Antrodiella citrinella TaxID=2447956 RepID=A0A4S4MVN7_9APHY|nr:hypothetical protein EUX98_g4890 [Antrodiella citrinella]
MTTIRTTLADGDSFYRGEYDDFTHSLYTATDPATASAFVYFDYILNAADQELMVAQALSMLERGYYTLNGAGFPLEMFESQRLMVLSMVQAIAYPSDTDTLTHEGLMRYMNDEPSSNAMVQFLRLLTSATMRVSPDEYVAYLYDSDGDASMSVDDFCANNVETMGREADQVQMAALSHALQVNFAVAYLDHTGDPEQGAFVKIEHGDPKSEPIRLLYRPGHYDIIFAAAQGPAGIGLHTID